jgi:hypothetical protein
LVDTSRPPLVTANGISSLKKRDPQLALRVEERDFIEKPEVSIMFLFMGFREN